MESTAPKAPKLLDRMQATLRLEHCRYRTEQSYLDSARRFILHPTGVSGRHPLSAVSPGKLLLNVYRI
jgi:hypothetical protein